MVRMRCIAKKLQGSVRDKEGGWYAPLTEVIWKQTTVGQHWIAERLEMKTAGNVSQQLRSGLNRAKGQHAAARTEEMEQNVKNRHMTPQTIPGTTRIEARRSS